MPYKIDLKELSQRENEKVEWKENGDDKDIVHSIVKTISAFANDIANFGGGYVVCGAKESKDEYGFQKLIFTGLTANKLKEIEGKVLQHCTDYISPSIAPIIQELDNPESADTRILVFIIVADSKAHTYRTGESSNYYVRVGNKTIEARNGILRQLLESKQQTVPFDKRPNPNVDEKDIDSLLFRDCMNEMGLLQPLTRLEDYFSDKEQIAEFVPPLLARKALDDTLCLRNFALFMFGKKESISLNFPDTYTVLSIYNGTDRSEPTGERYMLTGSIIEQTKKVIGLLDTFALTAFDKTSDKPNKEKYPKRALQEAVVNAIVHRDYEIAEPIRITVFSDRIEIRSPGTLHWGVDREKFRTGKAGPKWRNQSFAYLFNKLQLAQFEGQGIPTIINTMIEEGCPDPIFEIEDNSVTCILSAHPRHTGIEYEQFVAGLQQAILDSEEFTKQKNIVIERNKKLLDKNGIKRVFDLYWEYELGGFNYKTIIECKNYNSKVTMENIYSLLGKLHDFPDLRGVFATKTGYQTGVLEKARENNIDLLIVREQNESDWVDEKGNPLTKYIHIDVIGHLPAIVRSFTPCFDANWIKENTNIDISKPIQIYGLNDEIFIDDVAKNEKYSLYDLSSKLSDLEKNKPGDFERTFDFSNAYILFKDTKIKINSYKVNYSIQAPIKKRNTIDFSEELVGVIEYLSNGTKR